MSKHTPGPWEADADFPDQLFVPDYGRIWINGYDSEGGPIHIGCVDGPGIVERMANARLIVAAPDLLEALEALQPYVLHLPDGAPIKETIRAAIAKAKGEQL